MKKLLLFLVLIIGSTVVYATTYTSVADGDWNDPLSWSPVGVPDVTNSAAWPGDNVIIDHAVTFTGNLKTAKKASISINAGGALSVSGTLDIANSSPSIFTLASNGLLVAGNVVISTCCSTVTFDGTLQTQDFTFSGSKPISIGGMITINGDFDAGTNSSVQFTGGQFSVVGSTSIGGSAQLVVDGGAQLSLGDLSMTGDADIKGVGSGGIIGFDSIALANSSTSIQCINNTCNYHGGAGGGTPPNPLDLISGGQALPVELISFRAEALNKDQVVINWSTATESDNDYYLLEYSSDGKTFEPLESVSGQGTTFEQSDYQWVHDAPKGENNYYRLWQYDFDGTATLLGLEQIRLYPSTFTIAGVSPNPSFSGGFIRLDLPTDTHSIQVHLVCSSGQQWSLPFAPSVETIQLPDGLPSGIYYLRVATGTELQTIPLSIIGE